MNKTKALEIIQKEICKIEETNFKFIKEVLNKVTPEEKLLLALFGEDKISNKTFSYKQFKRYLANNYHVYNLRNKLKMIALGRYDKELAKINTKEELGKLIGCNMLKILVDEAYDDVNDEYNVLLETKKDILDMLNGRMERVLRLQNANAPKLIIEYELNILANASKEMQMIQDLINFFELKFSNELKK